MFFVPVKAQEIQSQKLDRVFQEAVANYDAGKFPEAEAALENLLPYATKSFEVHELLGLVYASKRRFALSRIRLREERTWPPRYRIPENMNWPGSSS